MNRQDDEEGGNRNTGLAEDKKGDVQDRKEKTSMDVDKSPKKLDESTTHVGEASGGTTNDPETIPPEIEREEPQRPATSSGWLSWFRLSQAPVPTSGRVRDTASRETGKDAQDEESSRPLGQPSVSEQPGLSEATDKGSGTDEQKSTSLGDTQTTKKWTTASSWFGLWPSPPTARAEQPPETMESPKTAETQSASKPDTDVDMADAPSSKPNEPSKPPSAGSTWAFWSRDSRTSETRTVKPQEERGELAVFGEGSESQPLPASSPEASAPGLKPDSQAKQGPATPVVTPAKSHKRPRPDSMEVDIPVPETPKLGQKQGKSTRGAKQEVQPRPDAKPAETPTKVKTPAKDTSGTAFPENLLLPSFSGTYRMKENPSIMRQIADFLLRTRQPPANHVYRVQEPPKIKKALAIGIHGLFPASYLKPLIGQPTGTSLRFANLAAEAIRRWTDDHGQGDCEIEKVALEGEGKISERVNNLWTLLLNWIDHIRRSDLIILACHSQGVPVTIILLAKLIDLGIVTNAKIGVCAMG